MGFIDDLAQRSCLALLVLSFTCLACQPPTPPETITGRGVVQKVVSADRRVVIAHDDLPGFMRAKTTSFEVRTPELLEALAHFTPGERIRFTLEKTAQTLYLVAAEREEEAGYP